MKKISLYITALVLGATAMQSCSDNWERPPMDVPTYPAGFKANMTIADLKTMYWQDQDTYGTEIGKVNGSDIWIAGTVVSSTEAGNIYKTVVLQDATGAITIGIDTTNLEKVYPMGVGMAVNVSGLAIGRYNGLVQLGQLEGTGVNRITNAEFNPHTMLDFFSGKLDTATVTISEMEEAARSVEGKIKWQSRLVRINDVKFQEAGQPFSNGSTTSRHIVDAEGNRMIVYNSSYADFAYDKMPYGQGDVVGILSCYRNSWQLLLIDKAGCIDFDGSGEPGPDDPAGKPEGTGTATDPYNVTAALAVAQGLNDTEKVSAYAKGTVKDITELSTQFGNCTYTITDGSAELSVYRGYYLNGDKFTAEDQLKVGDEVVVYGELVNFKGNTPQFTQGSRLVSINGQGGGQGQPAGGLTLLGESDAKGLEGWTVTNSVVWVWKEYNGKYYLNGQLFGVTPVPTEDAYAVSPKLTVGADAALSFDHAAKFQDSGLRTECGLVIREAGATAWTPLTIPTWPEAGAWTFVNTGSISLAAYAGKTVEIAFKYGCKATDTWEIRNLNLVNTQVAQ